MNVATCAGSRSDPRTNAEREPGRADDRERERDRPDVPADPPHRELGVAPGRVDRQVVEPLHERDHRRCCRPVNVLRCAAARTTRRNRRAARARRRRTRRPARARSIAGDDVGAAHEQHDARSRPRSRGSRPRPAARRCRGRSRQVVAVPADEVERRRAAQPDDDAERRPDDAAPDACAARCVRCAAT